MNYAGINTCDSTNGDGLRVSLFVSGCSLHCKGCFNKEAWDNIDIFGWMGYPMEIKVNFLCRDSILAAPIALDLVLFSDLALRVGMYGIQTWLSFFCKSPMHDNDHEPVHDLFQQWRIVKQTIRKMAGENESDYLD